VRPAVLGLVADDLTGAGDAAAGFADSGWRVVLRLRADRPIEAGVLAVSSRSRAATDLEAAALTARAVQNVLSAGAERLYLKIDSTVRGSVAGQIDGALTAWSTRHPQACAVICPAFPEQGRTVNGGRVLVAGTPVAETAAGFDPIAPRTISELTAIVPGAVLGDLAELSAGPPRRLVVDAEDDTDLDRLAAVLSRSGPGLIMVGSGGLAAALGRVWTRTDGGVLDPALDGPILIAVSSLHPLTAGQLRQLPADPTSGIDVVATLTETTTATAAADELAGRVVAALSTRAYAALVVVGGDGAAAILDRLGADQIAVDGAIVPGCPTGIVSGGSADGLRLVTKSGGFGRLGALNDIVHRLRPTAPRSIPGHHSAGRLPTQKDAP
jgi:uncharacterized protein YgbK (DUF1537 family)